MCDDLRYNSDVRNWLVLIFLLVSASRASADLSNEDWQVPIGNGYAVRFDPRERSRHEINQPGKYQLVESQGHSTIYVLTNLEQIAVTKDFAVGKAQAKYFVFCLAKSDDNEPILFDDEPTWRSQLINLGIDSNIQPNDPVNLASALSIQTIQPWKFKRMNGACGWDDSTWSLVFQIAGLVISVVMGLMILNVRVLNGVSVLLGLFVAFFAQSYIAGEGPGFCGALFVLPILYFLGAKFGHWLRELVSPSKPRGEVGLLRRDV